MIWFLIYATFALSIVLLVIEVLLVMLLLSHFKQLAVDERWYKHEGTTWKHRVYTKYLPPGRTVLITALNTLGFIPGAIALLNYLIAQL